MKPFKTIEGQIEILKSRALVIDDDCKAICGIISGYMDSKEK